MAENRYTRQLTAEEIAQGVHRGFVGGFWDEIGQLQFDCLVRQGLRPHHQLLDVGCGCLRGGLHFIRYLDAGGYCGLDINPSLIEAAHRELDAAGLAAKAPQLLVDDAFEAGRFGRRFDYAIALSLFTHLHNNHVVRCLARVAEVLAPGGSFFATFFEAPAPVHLSPLRHEPGGITTHYDRDPFHQSLDEIRALGQGAGLGVEPVEDWQHPRAQRMFCFRHLKRTG